MDDTLRTCFDQDADLYDLARPGFPAALLDDLARLGRIGPGTRVLEIGPGTGQATLDLARRGAEVTAVELGPALATRLRENVRHLSVDVVTSAFEQWPLPERSFDVMTSFRAWHWIDPAIRTVKAADAVRPGGLLATVSETHVAGGTPGFFDDVRSCFAAASPGAPMPALPDMDAVGPEIDEIDGSALFVDLQRCRYTEDVRYGAREYIDLLGTYPWRLMPPPIRDDFFARVHALIEDGYGGTITKRYLYELRTARRTGSAQRRETVTKS